MASCRSDRSRSCDDLKKPTIWDVVVFIAPRPVSSHLPSSASMPPLLLNRAFRLSAPLLTEIPPVLTPSETIWCRRRLGLEWLSAVLMVLLITAEFLVTYYRG